MARRSAVTLCWPASVPVTTRTTRSCFPVDFRTLEEHFGFGGEGEGEQPELVDEDGRMDPGPVGTMWDHGWGKQSVTNIEHDEMRGTWGEVICFAFFLCGPIGCPSHSD